MAFLDGIKSKLALSKIRQEAVRVQRERAVFNLDDSRTVGIAFNYSTPEDFDLLKKYVLYLRELKKKVKVIGIYEGKTEPAVQYSKVDYDFVNEKEFTWWGKPAGHIANNFVEEPYDIFIDVNMNNSTALNYIAYNSRAKFKIGHFAEDTSNPYDVLISVTKESGLKAYLREVDTCLQKINKPAKD